MVDASLRALAAAQLRPSDVDGLAVSSIDYYMPTVTLGTFLGLNPRFIDSTSLGGASPFGHLDHAIQAIEGGRCNVVLIVFGSTLRSDPPTAHRLSEPSNYEVPFGHLYPLGGFALMMARHIHLYGTRPEQLAAITVNARKWAAITPGAERPEMVTIQDVLASPVIASPLRRLDCCLVSDGAIALLVCRRDHAAHLPVKPVRVLGIAEVQSHRHISEMADLTVTPTSISGPKAMSQAGVTLKDVDFVELYDAATITVLLALEDLGFCSKGEGGAFIESSQFGPGGNLPLNTNGGGLAYRHPGVLGLYLLAEALAQLQGIAGGRQVAAHQVALVNAIGGVYGASGSAVLRVED